MKSLSSSKEYPFESQADTPTLSQCTSMSATSKGNVPYDIPPLDLDISGDIQEIFGPNLMN